MAKRATMTAGHLESMKARKPATMAASHAEPEPAKPAAAERKGMSLRLSTEAWKQLKRLALEEEKPAHDLVLEGLNAVFAKHSLPPIA